MTGESTADTATETTTATVETTTTESADETLSAIADMARELGITSGQLKGRLEASKKWETRAKQNIAAATELEQLKAASMSEQEKAVSAARAEARTETLREFGAKLVNAEIRAAAKGRVEDVDALIEGIDGSKFLDADGDPDRDAIAAWVDRIAPVHEETATSSIFPDLGQGNRGTDDKALNGNPLYQALKSKVGAK